MGLKEKVEGLTGSGITAESLNEAVNINHERRKVLQRLNSCRKSLLLPIPVRWGKMVSWNIFEPVALSLELPNGELSPPSFSWGPGVLPGDGEGFGLVFI